MILEQDRVRGVVILDPTEYTEKCMALLNTKRFKRHTAATGQKIQKVFRNINLNSKSTNAKDYTQHIQNQLKNTLLAKNLRHSMKICEIFNYSP